MTCPCGCGGAVKPGNRYAKPRCYSDLQSAGPRASRVDDDGATLDRDSIVQRLSWCRAHNPQSSWWVGCDRTEFRRRLAGRLPLMPISEFGRVGMMATAPDVQIVRRRVPAADVTEDR